MPRMIVAGFCLLAGFTAWQVAAAQQDDKEITAKGQVQIGKHSHKLESGQLYKVRVEGDGFRPILNARNLHVIYPQDGERGDAVEVLVVPKDTKSYRFHVSPDAYDELEDGPLTYKFSIRPVPLAAKPVLEEKAELTAKDPIYEGKDLGFKKDCYHKAYTIKMKAKQFYVIDMVKGKDDMDPYLYLEDGEKRIVASDDDSGGDLNARIIFQARRAGEFRIIATTLSKATGPFTLTVRTQKE